jgi:hypothetical protein
MATFVTNLLSGGLLQGVSGLINTIRGKSPEDAMKLAEIAAKYQSDILAADVQAVQAQNDVNKIEAASNSVFVAGWRPFIGWVCGGAFAINFAIGPLASWASALFGHPVTFPTLNMSDMLPVLMGMLGLGGMRSWEKVNGVKTGH